METRKLTKTDGAPIALYRWQEGYCAALPDALPDDTFQPPLTDRLPEKANQLLDPRVSSLVERQKLAALGASLRDRIEREHHRLLLFFSVCLLALMNLFFANLPGSISLLWVANVVFGIFIVYRLGAGIGTDVLLSGISGNNDAQAAEYGINAGCPALMEKEI